MVVEMRMMVDVSPLVRSGGAVGRNQTIDLWSAIHSYSDPLHVKPNLRQPNLGRSKIENTKTCYSWKEKKKHFTLHEPIEKRKGELAYPAESLREIPE